MTITELSSGVHCCFLFSREADQGTVVASFLEKGLKAKEKILYAIDSREHLQFRKWLREHYEVDLQPGLMDGQVAFIHSEDLYCPERRFDPERAADFLRRALEVALKQGYTGLRMASEMTWALRGLPGTERLPEYEAGLKPLFQTGKLTALCQYDQRCFPADLLTRVTASHPATVLGTEVRESFGYLKDPSRPSSPIGRPA